MKKNILYGVIIGFLTILYSCDVIEGDYMTSGTTNLGDTTSVVKKVLIEDFTGHRCPNCPSATQN